MLAHRATLGSLLVALGVVLTWPSGLVRASDRSRPLRSVPSRADLLGPDAVQQLAIEQGTADGGTADRTTSALYRSDDTKVADVDSSGLIVARGDGSTLVSASLDHQEARIPVRVRGFSSPPPMNFGNEVVPVFTKLGCNSGGCHGKASGQNGFRLSLMGFDPGLDYEALVKEDRGRRLFPAAPDRSLLLEKAVARVPHGGGRRMNPDSHEYRVVRRWIASGMPTGRPDDPSVARIDVYPPNRRITKGSTQQLIVTASYTDGRSEDVTRWAQYQTNDADVADVADGGRVRILERPGQAAVMARYQGRMSIFRAIVPLSRPSTLVDFRSDNPIDRQVARQWKDLGIEPSGTCSDAEFIRRASLDIDGTLPDASETQNFVADVSVDKRRRLVSDLIDRPEYANYFAIKWADVLRNKRDGKPENAPSTFRFHDWIRESLEKNVPYDQFVRAILTASGTVESCPPVVWYRRKKRADEYVDETAQVFLGMRLQCARCHHHPYEVWGQDDYDGFAAFFGRVMKKTLADGRKSGLKEEVLYSSRTGSVANPRTGRVVLPAGLGTGIVAVGGADDPRRSLVDWMASPTNPYFARALVNRYWAHFFGRGIVEPIDDLRMTNPPSNPELLDTLADSFIRSGYDLKALVRLIATSRAYGISSVPNESNAEDRQSFARHYPRRLSAEVLLDAISQVTASPTVFPSLPPGTRAIELPDEGVASGFLDAFGRPKRDTACECERVSEASLGQSLMLLNSADVQAKLTSPGGRAQRLSKDTRPDEAKVAELFWGTFGRPPDSGEMSAALAHLSADPDQKRLSYEDILWALLNAKEFQFND